MDERSESEQAAVFDFVCLFFEDTEREARRSLSEYLRRFPTYQDAVASEYLRLMQEERDPEEVEDLLEVPQCIGPYRLIRQLGAGGQGAVFLAEDTRISRKVALKLLHGGFVTQDRRARLKREAESIASLAHPGICAVLEAEVEGDAPYIAMQYLDGVDLGNALEMAREGQGLLVPALIPKTRVELVSVLQFFERTARALHAAHEAGVVHRDIKPGNIFVGKSGRPVVLDFGLARDDFHEDLALTRSGEIFGTPAYMSPEQWMGKRALISGRTDVFSLGVTLYEALLGHRPFQGASRFELEKAVLHESTPDPRSMSSALTNDVKVVLETALEKDPARRYESALAFAEDLRRIRVYEPVHARPASVGLRLSRWVRREPALATAIVGVFILLVVSLSIALTLLSDTKDALRLARGNLLTNRVIEVNETSPAAALSLGLEVLQMAPGHRARNALYGPLEDNRLRRLFSVNDVNHSIQTLSLVHTPGYAWIAFTDGVVRVFDFESGELVESLVVTEREFDTADKLAVLPLAAAPDGKRVVVGAGDGRLTAYDVSPNSGVAAEPAWTLKIGERTLSWLEYSPDGSFIVAQELHGETVVIDANLGSMRGRFGSAESAHTLARVSFDGTRIATSSAFIPPAVQSGDSGPPLLWAADTFTQVARLEGHERAVSWLDFGGDVLATASRDGVVRLFDAGSGASLARSHVALTQAALDHVDVHPDGQSVAFCSRQNGGEVWIASTSLDSTRRPLDSRLLGHEGSVFSCAYSPDGDRLATCAFDRTVRLWDSANGDLLGALQAYMNPLRAHWSPLGDQLTVQALTFQAFAFETRTSSYVYRFGDAEHDFTWGEFESDGLHAILGGASGKLGRFSTPRGKIEPGAVAPGSIVMEYEGLHAPVEGGQIDCASGLLLAWAGGGAVRTWSIATGEPRGDFQHEHGVLSADMAKHGTVVTTVDDQGVARLFLNGESPKVLIGEGATDVQISADGRWIVVSQDPCSLGVFDLSTGESVRTVEIETIPESTTDPVMLLFELLPDAPVATVVTLDSEVPLTPHIRVVDLVTGAQSVYHPAREAVKGEDAPPGTIVARWMKPFGDGNFAVAGSHGGGGQYARIHLADSYNAINPEMGANDELTSIDVDPTGRYAVTGSKGGQAIVWSVLDGAAFTIYDRHGPRRVIVRFDPATEEPRVLSICADGTAAVWPIDPMAAAEALQGRELYGWERRQYLGED